MIAWYLQTISTVGSCIKDPLTVCEAIIELTKNLPAIGQPQELQERKQGNDDFVNIDEIYRDIMVKLPELMKA